MTLFKAITVRHHGHEAFVIKTRDSGNAVERVEEELLSEPCGCTQNDGLIRSLKDINAAHRQAFNLR